MLVKNLLSSFFVFILLFSCGGGGTSSPSDEENFTFQKFLNGLVVDGYIKNAEVWIETTNDFSSFGETKTISNQLGSFNLSTQETNFRIQTSGGIDLDTNNSLDNLVLVNHKINDFVSNSEQPFIVSPLTTAVVNGETMKGCSELDTKSLILWFTKTRLSRLLLVSRSIPPEV